MQTYVVFVKNTKSGEEFAVPQNAPENGHSTAMAEVASMYPAANFHIHTAYTLKELENVMESVQRWPGVASKPQKEVQPRRHTSTAIPQVSLFATKGSLLNQPAKAATPAPQEDAKPVAPAEVVVASAAQQKENSGQSVISLLKAMREIQ